MMVMDEGQRKDGWIVWEMTELTRENGRKKNVFALVIE